MSLPIVNYRLEGAVFVLLLGEGINVRASVVIDGFCCWVRVVRDALVFLLWPWMYLIVIDEGCDIYGLLIC